MTVRPHLDDEERRRRLAARHSLAPSFRHRDAVAAATAMTALHATEPATVYLSLAARVDGLRFVDVESALYSDRTLVKQLAMRRTLFALPRDLLPAAWASAAARVHDAERRRTIRDVEASGVSADGAAWLVAAGKQVVDLLDREVPLTTAEIRERLPMVAGTIAVAPNSSWGGNLPVLPRLLAILGAQGSVVRGPNAGHWRLSRPRWTTMRRWLGTVPPPVSAHDGYVELVRRWLATFGPGTVADLRWWLGSTVSAVRTALTELHAVSVGLDGGAAGWVLPDDVDPTPAAQPGAALLPVLDPSTMGWQQRDFYLGPHRPLLFDRAGNAGTTAWWAGRVVGCWTQKPDGEVQVTLVEDVGREARSALDEEAARLTALLGGTKVGTVYPSPLMRAARAGSG